MRAKCGVMGEEADREDGIGEELVEVGRTVAV